MGATSKAEEGKALSSGSFSGWTQETASFTCGTCHDLSRALLDVMCGRGSRTAFLRCSRRIGTLPAARLAHLQQTALSVVSDELDSLSCTKIAAEAGEEPSVSFETSISQLSSPDQTCSEILQSNTTACTYHMVLIIQHVSLLL